MYLTKNFIYMIHSIIYPTILLEILPRDNTLLIPHGSF